MVNYHVLYRPLGRDIYMRSLSILFGDATETLSGFMTNWRETTPH